MLELAIVAELRDRGYSVVRPVPWFYEVRLNGRPGKCVVRFRGDLIYVNGWSFRLSEPNAVDWLFGTLAWVCA